MNTLSNIQDLLKSAEQPFDVIDEFAALSPKRKVLLCEYLFTEGRALFQNTVSVLWPEAGVSDIKKLERHLLLMKKAAH